MADRKSTLQVVFTVDGDGKVKAALNGVGADADKSGKSIDNLSKELLALNERLDKNAAKTNQLARDRAVLDASLQKGLITQKEHNKLLGESIGKYDGLIAKARIAGAVLGGALVLGIGAVFKATAEADAVQAQLASGIADTGGAAQRTLPQLNALADALQHATTFDDEAIGGVEKVLLTFRNIKDVNFDKATASVLDLSTKLGVDLQSAAIQVGKALNDPILGVTALGRAGVQFSEDQKKLIKSLVDTGDVAGAQTIILKELEGEMGTAAEAARNTLGGALVGLKNDFENLLEGDSGSDGVRGTVDSINDLSDVLNDPEVKAGFQAIAQGIFNVSAGILEGIGLLAQYVAKYNEIKALGNGDLSRGDASDAALQNRLAAVGSTISDLKGGIVGKVNAFYNPNSALSYKDGLTLSPAAALKQLEAERTTLIREMTNRNRAELGQLPLGVPQQLGLQDALGGLQPFSAVGPAPFSAIGTGGTTGKSGAKPKSGGAAAATNGEAAAHRAAAEAARQHAEAEKALQQHLAEVSDAQGEFKTRVEDLRAELEGPMAQAQLAHNRELDKYRDLAKKGEIGATDLAAAEKLLREQFDQEAAAIKRRMDPAAELIQQMQDELRLRTLNNAEARTAVDLAHLSVPATAEQAQQVLALNKALEEQQKNTQLMDEFRSGLADVGMTAVFNFGKVDESFGDMMDGLAQQVARRILEGWIASAFGDPGTTGQGTSGGGFISGLLGALFGSGSGNGGLSEDQMYAKSTSSGGLAGGTSGGGWAGLISSFMGLFGGGRAEGGTTQAGHFYRVNEMRPELLEVGGSTWLMMGGQDGRVHANRESRGARGGDSYNITVPVTGHVDNYTRLQIANDTAFAIRRGGRNQ